MNKLLSFLASVTAFIQISSNISGQEAADVRIEKGISYLSPEKADLYLPPKFEVGKKYPGVIIIHGGGWTGGKRDAAREINIGTTLAANGYVCMSIDYLLHDPKSDQ